MINKQIVCIVFSQPLFICSLQTSKKPVSFSCVIGTAGIVCEHFYHRLRGSGSTVVTMTSKVNGKTEILTLCRSETPENIEAKRGVNDYVMDPYNLANFCGNRSKGVCSPYW